MKNHHFNKVRAQGRNVKTTEKDKNEPSELWEELEEKHNIIMKIREPMEATDTSQKKKMGLRTGLAKRANKMEMNT